MQARSSLILFSLFIILCSTYASGKVITGAERMDQYLPLIKGKRVGMVVNHTSIVGTEPIHLLDTLLKQKSRYSESLCTGTGFRGNADAGETVKDGKDSRTGVTIVSLYGDNKKPTAAQLKDIDVILFDIQDVGARFYTYISTMYYVMEACAENKKEMIILDRPNPCDYVEGPVLKAGYKKFCRNAAFAGSSRLYYRRAGADDQWRRMDDYPGKDLSADCDSRKRVETRTALCTSRETVSQLAQCTIHPPLCLTLPF